MRQRLAKTIPDEKGSDLSKNSDITNLLERLEVFEERLEVRLEALFATRSETGCLIVNGELHPRTGMTINRDITLQVDAHDSSGRLVATALDYIFAGSFFGFEAFQIIVQLPVAEVSKFLIDQNGFG
jgi:hypothetical protein